MALYIEGAGFRLVVVINLRTSFNFCYDVVDDDRDEKIREHK